MRAATSPSLDISRRDSGSPVILSEFNYSGLPPRFAEMRDYLEAKAGHSGLPRPNDIVLDEVPNLRPYVNLVDVIQRIEDHPRFRFHYVGATQISMAGKDLTGQFVDDAFSGDGGRIAMNAMRLAVEKRAPILGRFPLGVRGRDFITGERILFPLSSDGIRVDQLLSIHNFEAGGLEEALLWAENRFRSIVDSSIQGIWVHRDFKLLFANDGAAKMLGYERAEDLFEIDSLGVFFPSDQRNRTWEFQKTRLAGGHAPERYETQMLRRDGIPIWVEIMASLVEWDGIPAIVGTFFDISEHKRTEERLRAREQQFRDLAAGPIQGMLIHRNSKPLYVNQTWCDILGYANPEEYLAQGSILPNIAENRRADLNERARQRLAGARPPEDYEYEACRKDGSFVWLRNVARLVEWDGQTAIQSVIVDITEQRETEARLRQSQKMEAVGQLTGGIAHDFNNLLAVISGNAELLALQSGQDNPHVEAILRSTKRGADLTQHLLAFSRKQALKPQPLDLNTALSDILEVLRRTLGETIEVELSNGEGLWTCEADLGQLENAILNLALNASDAMQEGGKLTIGTSNARLDESYTATQAEVEPGDYTRLSITDTGCGIAPEVREHVFEPFFTTKPVGKGSGLGLSMVYGFAKQSGGHVTIESRSNEGTEVSLYLPRAAISKEAAPLHDTAATPVATGERILVVEDDPDVRELTVALLENLGYQVVEAATGRVALEILSDAGHVDLLLTDVILPGNMNGRELSQLILQQRPDIKVLFMSGYAEDVIVHQGRLDTDARLLQKPFRKAALARALRQVLGKQEN